MTGVLTALLIVFGAYFVAPLLWLLVAATKDAADLYATSGFWLGRRFQLWPQLRGLFTADDGVYSRWLINSALYSIGGAGAATLLAAACGYAMAVFVFRGRERNDLAAGAVK